MTCSKRGREDCFAYGSHLDNPRVLAKMGMYHAVPKNIHSLLPQKGLEFLGGGGSLSG